MKKVLRLEGIFLFFIFAMLVYIQPVKAANPSFSDSRYGKMMAPKDMNVYQNSQLSVRGTYSPSKKSAAYVSRYDELYIYQMTPTYTRISFPTSTGRRKGYIRTSDLTSNNWSQGARTSRATITTYNKKSSGMAKCGYVAPGDSVYAMERSGSYTLVVYPTGTTYRIAWITNSAYNTYIAPQFYSSPINNVVNTSSTYQKKCDAFLSDSRWRNGVSFNSSRRPYMSNYSCKGCCAYAADFVKYVFGKTTPTAGTAFYSPSAIRAGDVIKVTGSEHWLVVLSRNGNSLRTAEGNWSSKVCVSSSSYTIQNGQLYRDGKKFRNFSVGYHFQ